MQQTTLGNPTCCHTCDPALVRTVYKFLFFGDLCHLVMVSRCFGKELQAVPANPGTHATMPSFPAASSVERRVSKLPAWKRFTGFSLGAHRCSQAQPLGSKDSKQFIPVGNFRGIFPGCSHQHAVCTNLSVFMCVSFSLA